MSISPMPPTRRSSAIVRTAKLIVPGDALTHSSSRSCALARFIGQIGRNPASRVALGSSNQEAKTSASASGSIAASRTSSPR